MAGISIFIVVYHYSSSQHDIMLITISATIIYTLDTATIVIFLRTKLHLDLCLHVLRFQYWSFILQRYLLIGGEKNMYYLSLLITTERYLVFTICYPLSLSMYTNFWNRFYPHYQIVIHWMYRFSFISNKRYHQVLIIFDHLQLLTAP